MEKWQLSGIIANDTHNKLVIPKRYIRGPEKYGMIGRLFEVFRQGAKQLSKVTAIF